MAPRGEVRRLNIQFSTVNLPRVRSLKNLDRCGISGIVILRRSRRDNGHRFVERGQNEYYSFKILFPIDLWSISFFYQPSVQFQRLNGASRYQITKNGETNRLPSKGSDIFVIRRCDTVLLYWKRSSRDSWQVCCLLSLFQCFHFDRQIYSISIISSNSSNINTKVNI